MAGEKAPPPVNPNEAAKKLRLLATNALRHINEAAASPTAGGGDSAQFWLAAGDETLRLNTSLMHLESAITTRRVTDLRAALDNVRRAIVRERTHRVEAYNRKGTLSSPAMTHLQSEIQQIADLVQSLPTVPDLPVGNMQNMLRAIMAILRTGGFEGAETLTWEEVTKHANAAETKNKEAALAAAVSPVGV